MPGFRRRVVHMRRARGCQVCRTNCLARASSTPHLSIRISHVCCRNALELRALVCTCTHMNTHVHLHSHACLRRHVPTQARAYLSLFTLKSAQASEHIVTHTPRHAPLPALIAWDAAYNSDTPANIAADCRTPKHIFQHTSYPEFFVPRGW